ncbi:MAG: hypothetical protein Q9159_006282 [Coniocarpon cinnabarinum]
MQDQSDAAAWAALTVAAFAMIIAIGQMSQQYASSGQLIRLCDSVVYGGPSGLPGKGRRVWSWSQFRFRVLYEVPSFRLPRGKGNIWDVAPLTSVRFDEEVDIVANDKYWSALTAEPQVGEAAWVSFCRKTKFTCQERVIISLKHDDADRVPPELPNIPVPISVRDVIIMAFSIGLDCTEADFTRRALTMQGDAGVITSSNHPVLGLLVHFAPKLHLNEHPQPKHWRHWIARMFGGVPVAEDVLAWNGKHGLMFYENADILLKQGQQSFNGLSSRHHTIFGWGGTNTSNKSSDENDEFYLQDAKGPRDPMHPIMREILQEDGPDDIPIAMDHRSRRRSSKANASKDSDKIFYFTLKPLEQHNNGYTESAPEPIVVSRGDCTSLKWYWISQMNVVEGHFASPWRDSIDQEICIRAFGINLRNLIFDDDVGLSCVKFPSEGIRDFFGSAPPTVSYPPYVVNTSGPPPPVTYDDSFRRQGAPPPLGWKYYKAFRCDLPEIATFIENYFTFDDFNSNRRYNAVSDSILFVHELMRFDHWLHRAGETKAIRRGKAQLLRNAPALVQFVLEHFYDSFKYCYVTGHSGRECSEKIRWKLEQSGLSPAEITFITVAILRTLRYAFCLGSGLNTKHALPILWQDLAGCMV